MTVAAIAWVSRRTQMCQMNLKPIFYVVDANATAYFSNIYKGVGYRLENTLPSRLFCRNDGFFDCLLFPNSPLFHGKNIQMSLCTVVVAY